MACIAHWITTVDGVCGLTYSWWVPVCPGRGELRVRGHVLRRPGRGRDGDPHPRRGTGRISHHVKVRTSRLTFPV